LRGQQSQKITITLKMEVQNSDDWLQIAYVPERGTKYKTIEWIGYDNDSFSSE